MTKKPKKVVGVEPPRLKALSYDQLMLLSEDDIKALFPLGASQDGKKWIPATGKPDRTLARLLRDKRKRIQPTRLLGKTHGYTTNPLGALKTWPDDAGEAVDEESQRVISDEARERFVKPEKSLSERMQALEKKLHAKQLASLKRRVEALERATHDKAA